MNKFHAGAVFTLVLAVVFIGLSIANDEGAVHIFLVFPVITVNSLYSGLGALCIFLTFIFFFAGFLSGYELAGWDELAGQTAGDTKQRTPSQQGAREPGASKKVNIQGGGMVLIGPIPIIFGSNQKLTLIVAGIALVIMIVAFLFILM